MQVARVARTGRRAMICFAVVLCASLVSLDAMAQPPAAAARKSAQAPKIGVVDLTRLVNESPQAQQAKDNMARRFAERKNALEQAADALDQQMDKLKQNSDSMSDAGRDALSANIRDAQRKLTLKQSQYNDDVSDAEDKELKHLRSDLRSVIDAYAKAHGYDVILGNSVLYARPGVDVTDQILARLNK